MWTRDQTREWITQLENRIEDIDYYLKRTVNWCENRFIHDDHKIFILSFITCIWVSYMRDEPITYNELMELLGLENMTISEDKIYEISPKFMDLEYEEMLDAILENLEDY